MGAGEGLLEVVDDVLGVLETDREAQDIRVGLGLCRDRAVGECRGVLDERVHAAEGHGVRDELAGGRHRGGGVEATPHREGHHGSGPTHLAADQPGRVVQPGVVDGGDRRVGAQPSGHLLRPGLSGTHPDGKRLQTPVELVGRHRVQKTTGQGPDLAQAHRPLAGRGHDPAEQVAVATERFGRRVQHEGGAVANRVLQHRSREGVVDEDGHLARLRHDGLDVDEVKGGIRRGLEDDQACVVGDCGSDGVGRCPGDSRAEQSRGQDVVGAAVERAHGDDMWSAGGHGREQRGAQGGHAGGEGDRFLRALEVGQGALEAVDVGVPQPLVDQSVDTLGPLPGRELLVGLATGLDLPDRVGAGQVDGRHVDAEGAQVLTAGVDGSGVDGGHGGSSPTGERRCSRGT